MARVHNFNAGPAALPLEVLETARDELLDFRGSGMSVMETSHRSKEYDAVHHEAMTLFNELLELGDHFKVLLLQGGASLQFDMVPMNLLGEGRSADYILTGAWSQKAFKEAALIGTARVAGSTEKDGVFSTIPEPADLDLDAGAVYCHLTSNNTIFGTQWRSFPDTGGVPLVADMSSDILSRRFETGKFGIIYAGAQKNLGPSGVTVVAVRDDMFDRMNMKLPALLSYRTHADNESLYNTPPSFSIYLLGLTLKWVKAKGGVEALERENEEKVALLYGAMDQSGGFYKCPVPAPSRSHMNIVFRLPSEELEARFLADGKAEGFVGMKGHRSVGGIRISAYNVNGLESVRDVVGFMKMFAAKHG